MGRENQGCGEGYNIFSFPSPFPPLFYPFHLFSSFLKLIYTPDCFQWEDISERHEGEAGPDPGQGGHSPQPDRNQHPAQGKRYNPTWFWSKVFGYDDPL